MSSGVSRRGIVRLATYNRLHMVESVRSVARVRAVAGLWAVFLLLLAHGCAREAAPPTGRAVSLIVTNAFQA